VSVLAITHRQEHQIVFQGDAGSKRREHFLTELGVGEPEIGRDTTLLPAELLLCGDKVAHAVWRSDPIAGEARDDSWTALILGLNEVVAYRIEFRVGRVSVVLHSNLKLRRNSLCQCGAPTGALLHCVHVALCELKLALHATRTERRPLTGSAGSRGESGAQLVFDGLAACLLRPARSDQ
jgi:hypothetical protein